ncbi:branched-chain amino acid ABC transporter substrate-binding protein [Gordonia defluvii]|jgi:branched-chain amino acid transport system substrate-binding protein|uniref:Branched-chain amino acid ABC transporter substrate-binding protein n=1 Tax=Gordonia defluvii TaxID=283718 RepID=A0ABP6LF09_9ACTN|nr:branched-chain amino acid ABC transporter substrate-binding protein [Gordonia sp. UBA5067]
MKTRQGGLAVATVVVAVALGISGCASSHGPAVPSAASRAAGASGNPAAPAVPTSVPPGETGLAITTVGQLTLAGQRFDPPAPASPANPAGDGKAACPRLTVAVVGDLSTRDGIDGTAIANGAQLAVDQHNAANPRCQLVVRRTDTKGNGVVAAEEARRLAARPDVVAVIGPLTSSDALAAGPTFHAAGLVNLSPSATAPTLTDKGWKTFFRGVNNDDVQGAAIARYLVGAGGRKKVCVIADNTDGGAGLARAVTQGLGGAAVQACSTGIQRGSHAYGPAVDAVVKAAADGVYFAGSARDGGAFAAALRQAAPTVVFAAGDEANNPDFLAFAGAGADGALLSCSCSPAPDAFSAAYATRFGGPPARYSLEAYDLATVIIRGIAAGKQTRPHLRAYVADYSGDGLSRHYQWAPTGDLIGNTVWLSRVGPA